MFLVVRKVLLDFAKSNIEDERLKIIANSK